MLPRTNGVRAAYAYHFAAGNRAYDVGNEAIGRPVTAADYVTGTSASEGDAVLAVRQGIEERIAVRRCYEFGTPFTVAVRIVTPHRLIFTIAPQPLFVFVALVA